MTNYIHKNKKNKMTKNSLKLIILTTLLLTSISLTTGDIIQTSCNQTPHPQQCDSLLRAAPGPKNNLTDLMPLIVDIVYSHYSYALQIARIWSQISQDPQIVQGAQCCVEYLSVVTDVDVRTSRMAIEHQHYENAVDPMLDAGTQSQSCHDAFPPGKVPRPFTGRSRTLKAISDIAASLLGLLL